MKLKLLSIVDNPYRDMSIDPINDEAVDSLAKSIEDHEFWNGLLVRKYDNQYQLVFGHHRLRAAIKAGVVEADIPIVYWDDDRMVRAMAAENATQRQTNFSACANDVAAAMRVLGYAMLTNDEPTPEHLRKIFRRSKSWDTAKGMFLKGSGLGIDIVCRYFSQDDEDSDKEQMLSMGVVREVIAQMKASGKLAEITEEVIDRAIEDGHEFELPEIKNSERTFDMAVGQVLTDTSHLAAFRKAITTEFAKEVVPVKKQVALAKEIVNGIKEDYRELPDAQGKKRPLALTSEEISRRTKTLVRNAQGVVVEIRKKLERKDDMAKAKHEWSFLRNKLSHTHGHALKLERYLKDGIIPDGFDSELARHFFDNDLKQCLATIERVRKLLPLTIINN